MNIRSDYSNIIHYLKNLMLGHALGNDQKHLRYEKKVVVSSTLTLIYDIKYEIVIYLSLQTQNIRLGQDRET